MTQPQSDLASWVSAISTLAATIVALSLATWEVLRSAADRRDRQIAQARLVTIEVDPTDVTVKITNHSDRPIHQPRVASISNPRLTIRWGIRGDLPSSSKFKEIEILAAHEHCHTPFGYYHSHSDDFIRPADHFLWVTEWVEAKNVAITFIDAAGLRWRRTGHQEPVRDFRRRWPLPRPRSIKR